MRGIDRHRMKGTRLEVAFLAYLLFLASSVNGQNAPVSTIGTVNSYSGSAVVAVTAEGVSDIGSFSMKIQYDPSIAQAVSVIPGPLLGGSIAVNLNIPGQIFASWYTASGITLPGTADILSITFNKAGTGVSPLTWVEDGISCSWFDGNGNMLTDTPLTTYYLPGSVAFLSPDAPHTIAPVAFSCSGAQVSLPVKVTAFNSIGSIQLRLLYDVQQLGYQSFQNVSGFPGLAVNGSQPGVITITGTISQGGGFSLPDSSVLVMLNFLHTGGSTPLTWEDNGPDCQYGGPPPEFHVLNDLPAATYYHNGSVSMSQLPAAAGAITGPAGGLSCEGMTMVTFHVDPIPLANTYQWSLPPDATIVSGAYTNSILVNMGEPGNWDVTVNGANGCGAGQVSPLFPLAIQAGPQILAQPVSPPAVITGAGTAQFEVVAAGESLTFQWQHLTDAWYTLQDTGCYSGVTSAKLIVQNPSLSMNGRHYRCLIGGSCPPDTLTDGTAYLTVETVIGLRDMDPGSVDGSRPLFTLFPNPAVSGNATLEMDLPVCGSVTATISDPTGRQLFIQSTGMLSAGNHRMILPVASTPGICFLTIRAVCGTEIYFEREKLIKR